MTTTTNILNLGAGVQSTAVLLRSLHGDLPPLDYVVFADTQWEPVAVYEHLERLTAYAAARGVTIHRVTRGNLRAEYLASVKGGRGSGGKRFASIPVFVAGSDGRTTPVRRQCTSEYKIAPIERFIRREVLGLKPRQRWPKDLIIRQWFGISIDEFQRTRGPSRPTSVHYYPLCGVEFRIENGVSRSTFEGERWTRKRCEAYLAEHWPHPVPRSSCIGCPYHGDDEWQRLTPDEFADAVAFDKAIRRQANLDSEAYLHRSMVPLDEVVWSKQQPSELFGDCEGMCGV